MELDKIILFVINNWQELVTVSATVAIAIFAGLSLIVTKRQTRIFETQTEISKEQAKIAEFQTRIIEAQIKPYLVFRLYRLKSGGPCQFEIWNLGYGPAINLRFRIDDGDYYIEGLPGKEKKSITLKKPIPEEIESINISNIEYQNVNRTIITEKTLSISIEKIDSKL